jgi:hypothetical protein
VGPTWELVSAATNDGAFDITARLSGALVS